MRCPYCGTELEDFASFCSVCGKYALPLQNDNPESASLSNSADSISEDNAEDHLKDTCEMSPPKKVQRLYPPPEEQKAKNKHSTEAPLPPDSQSTNSVKQGFGMIPTKYRVILLVLVIALIGTACGLVYVVTNTANMRAQLRRAQSDQTTAEENAAGLETQVSELQAKLEEVRAEAEEKAQEIAELTSQIADMESSVTQNTYDKEAAQRQLEEAQSEITALNTELTDIENQLAEAETQLAQAQTDLSAAQEENKTLTDENKALTAANAELTKETDFYDSYVVFVMTTATDKYYHKYDCPNFTQKSFLAYSTKLAESNGYTPCPVCIGSAS